jgi:hypothetical protein
MWVGIDVAPAELQAPADQFRRIGEDFRTLAEALGGMVAAAGPAAGNGDVEAGCAVFRSGMQAALPAFADDADLLGKKVRWAAVTYADTDDAAIAISAPAAAAGPRPG